MNINKILIIYKNVIWYIHMWCMYIYIYIKIIIENGMKFCYFDPILCRKFWHE